jgi:hypothetical protein
MGSIEGVLQIAEIIAAARVAVGLQDAFEIFELRITGERGGVRVLAQVLMLTLSRKGFGSAGCSTQLPSQSNFHP